MKKNGYTVIELLVLMVFLGVITFFVITRESHAFTDNDKQVKETNTQDLSLIEFASEKYAEENKTLFASSNTATITVEELITKNYLTEDYVDNKDMQIKITYNKEAAKYQIEINR